MQSVISDNQRYIKELEWTIANLEKENIQEDWSRTQELKGASRLLDDKDEKIDIGIEKCERFKNRWLKTCRNANQAPSTDSLKKTIIAELKQGKVLVGKLA